MGKMVSMKMDEKEMKEQDLPTITRDPYPYGLRLNLCEEEMTKLGINSLPEIGKELTISAKVKVTRVSSNASEGQEEEHRSLELQITDMAVDGAGKEKSAASTLYADEEDGRN